MIRRNFVKNAGALGLAATFLSPGAMGKPARPAFVDSATGREYWLRVMDRIARPVLANLAAGTLKRNMPVESAPGQEEIRPEVTYLEAFGRTLTGIAPWLAAEGLSGEEKKLQEEYRQLCLQALERSVSPGSPDLMNFTQHAQPLVDAAFLAHALIKAPRALWHPLDGDVKRNLISALRSTRSIRPYYSNWLLFSAMIEAFFLSIDEQWDPMRVDLTLRKFEEWYLGDGHYGDGAEFHWDYYNSLVIQPFLYDIIDILANKEGAYLELQSPVRARAQRYAEIQERLIAPDGTYPAIGRSIAYRFGAFQHLAHMSYRDALPDSLPPAQVRSALTAVIKKTMEARDNFDGNGWLKIGLYGAQPGLGEFYISTGSLYLCAAIFLPLGLPPEHAFWASPGMEWTAVKIWGGTDMKADAALKH